MRTYKWLVGIAIIAGSLVALAEAQESREKGGVDATGAYEVQQGWPQQAPGSDGWVSAPVLGIFAESPDRVFIIQQGQLPIPASGRPGGPAPTIFGAPGRAANSALAMARRQNFIVVANREGKIVESWTQWDSHWEGSTGPHHIKINPYDPERHVWIVDDGASEVVEFTNDGKTLVKSWGERGKQGNDQTHFGRPADIAWLPDGTFYVTDGYANKRVVKFDKNGNYLMEWGKEGMGPGEFRGPVHAVAIDNNRRLYVADRGNDRIQVFDENGKFLDAWPNIPEPWDVHVATDQSIWVVDGNMNKFLKYDSKGKLLGSWGTYGQFPGGLWGVHGFSVDSEGNVYTAEALNGRAQKFVPVKGADPKRQIGPDRPMAGKPSTN